MCLKIYFAIISILFILFIFIFESKNMITQSSFVDLDTIDDLDFIKDKLIN